MRFRALDLVAFGHFTQKTLSFEAKPLAFHLIYGHNEAGKSTALRAVHDLLYGIPQQSADTFLHTGPELRIGAILENDGGEELRIVRRKGRKNTLLAPDGSVLDEATVLLPWLGGVDETLFRSMFGLDHETLRHGARDLLAGTGSLSESLFGASVGTGKTHRLLSELRQQADELFTTRGRGKKRINQEIADVREAHKLVAQHSTTAQSYHERERNLELSSREMDSVKTERAQLKAKKSRLERLLAILPRVAKLRAIEHELATLGELPELPDGVEEWRTEALNALLEKERQASFLNAEIERQLALLEELTVPEALLELSVEAVESIGHRLGQYRKARIDLPKRQGELRAVRDEADELLRSLNADVTLEEADTLRLSKPEEQRARRLCREKVRLDATLVEREVSFKETQRNAARRKRDVDALKPPVDETPLRAALERARAHTDLDERLEDERKNIALGERDATQRFEALGRFEGDVETLLELPLPQQETVKRFEHALDAADEERARLEQRGSELRQRMLALSRDLLELESDGAVPSQSELSRLREVRDELLTGLRAAARRGEHCDPARLSEALDRLHDRIRDADQHADRLRVEAASVSKAANISASLASAEEETAWLEQKLTDAEARTNQLTQEWTALWRPLGIEPLPPKEMQGWLGDVRELSERLDAVKAKQNDVRKLESRMADVEKDLTFALEALGKPKRTLWESPSQFAQRAQTTLRDVDQDNQRHREAHHRLTLALDEEDESGRRLTELKDAQKQFRSEWAKMLRGLGLDKDASVDEVTDTLDRRGELFHRLKEAGDLERRINGIFRDEEQLQKDVDALSAHAVPDLVGLPTSDAAERLLRAHKKATVDGRERVRLQVELERHQGELRRVENDRKLARERLQELLRLARVSTAEELAGVERQVQRARLLVRQRRELEDEIVAHGEGSSLDQLLAEAEATSGDELREHASQAEVDVGILDERLENLVRRRTTAENQLQELGAGAFAAAEELAQRTAKLRVSVRRYMKLRLASAILEREVERYRDEHQGPVLKLASQLFPELTLGAYGGLKVGFDKNDHQILLCVSRDQSEKDVTALSDGARDQLYLSLRLATLRHHMEHTTRMPLILDDILIHFDDERARATLAVLGELAEQTQVLFFTHHRRLVELAHEAIPSPKLQVCELGTSKNDDHSDVREMSL